MHKDYVYISIAEPTSWLVTGGPAGTVHTPCIRLRFASALEYKFVRPRAGGAGAGIGSGSAALGLCLPNLFNDIPMVPLLDGNSERVAHL